MKRTYGVVVRTFNGQMTRRCDRSVLVGGGDGVLSGVGGCGADERQRVRLSLYLDG